MTFWEFLDHSDTFWDGFMLIPRFFVCLGSMLWDEAFLYGYLFFILFMIGMLWGIHKIRRALSEWGKQERIR